VARALEDLADSAPSSADQPSEPSPDLAPELALDASSELTPERSATTALASYALRPSATVVAQEPEKAPVEALATNPARPRYAIQLASFRRRATVASAARRAGILEQASTLEPVRGWYPLLFGDYATRAEAQAVLDDLPQRLRRQGPIIRALDPGTQRLPLP
jgi:septal ring-binding cell division protein DamX